MIDRAYWHARRRASEQTVAYVMTDRPGLPARRSDPDRRGRPPAREGARVRGRSRSRTVRMMVRDPKGQEVFDQRLKTDASGAFSQEIVLRQGRPARRLPRPRSSATGKHVQIRQLPDRGVPEARVRGDGRASEGAGAARVEGPGDDRGELLLRRRRARRRGDVARLPRGVRPRLHVAPPLDVRRRGVRAGARGGGRELVLSGQGSLVERRQARDRVRHGGVRRGRRATARTSSSRPTSWTRRAGRSADRRRSCSRRRRSCSASQPRRGFYVAGDFVECETQSRLPTGPRDRRDRARSRSSRSLTRKRSPDGTTGRGPDASSTKSLTRPTRRASGFFRWQPDVGGYFAIVFEAPRPLRAARAGRDAASGSTSPATPYRDFAFANIELVPDQRHVRSRARPPRCS